MRYILMAGCLFFCLASAKAAKINGALSLQGDTVHLEFVGQENWDYDMKRLDRKGQVVVEMTVPELDESSIKALTSFKSDLIKNVFIDRGGPDKKHVLQIVLSGENVDSFDYLTDQPSRLIVDFFANPASAKKAPSVVKEQKLLNKTKTEKNRKPATSDVLVVADKGISVTQKESPVKSGIFDGGDPDYDRFSVKDYEIKEDAVIRANDNYYIPFPMLERNVSHWEKLKLTPTIYEVSSQDTDENKQARLLLTLFEKERFGVYLKTELWFREKYPNSAYKEVIDFMTADVFLTLSERDNSPKFFNEAVQRYKEAIQHFPKSPLAERTSLKLGYLTLEKGDYVGALRLFNEHIENKNFPTENSLSKDLARLGTALTFAKLKRWDDAISNLDVLENKSIHRDLKVDAAYRRGDVWLRAKQYSKSVEDYQRALKKYPEGQNYYPNAYFNQAEALFWQKKYRESLNVYRDFLKKFPSENHVAFATTRIGELLDIFGVDKSRSIGAYLETYFRFGEAPEAVVARLRLLSARMKGMKPKEVNHAVGEITSLAKKIDLPNIQQFATVMVADGYNRREEYQKSLDLLSKYYKENPNSVDVPLMTNRIVSTINDKIRKEVIAGDFIDALQTHSQYADSWLKNSKRLDTKYNVGRAFEMAGSPVEAETYYRDTLNRIYAMKGTAEAKEVSAKEVLPSEDDFNLRLAAVNADQQKYNQAYEYLKNIKAPGAMSDSSQIERVDVAVRLLEKRGDNDSAIRYLGELLRTWKGKPELVAGSYLKLAQLQQKNNRVEESLQALQMVESLQKDSGSVPAAVHAKALEMLGDLYLEQNKKNLAMKSYQELLEKYEDSRPLASIRYKLGQIYFKEGSVKKASEVWSEFKGEKSSFWSNLAQEQLKNSQWRDDYQKYIKRIPAMSENEQGK